MAHMSPGHLRGHFEDFSRGSLLEGAELEIEESEDAEDPNAQSVLLLSVDVVD
jgi:hydrogenase nickel incorporation protein HypA/HybF